jgi:hypothetical protein
MYFVTEFVERLLTKKEAARYCKAKSVRTFDRWRAKGIIPGPIPGTRRWDQKALDAYLDIASGLVKPNGSPAETDFDRWLRDNGYGD